MICPYCKTDFGVKNPKYIFHNTPDHRLQKDKYGWFLELKREDIFIGKMIRNQYYINIFGSRYDIPPLKISNAFKKINDFKKLRAFL